MIDLYLRKVYLLLLVIFISGFSAFSVAKDKAGAVIFKFYQIKGNDLSSLEASILKNQPNGHSSGNEWHISWQYGFEEKKDGCYLINPVVNKKAIIILPQWRDQGGANTAVKSEWQRYVQALKQHQLGHIAFADKAQKAILTGLSHTPKEVDCDKLKKSANQVAKQILNDFYEKDRLYEKATKSHMKDLHPK